MYVWWSSGLASHWLTWEFKILVYDSYFRPAKSEFCGWNSDNCSVNPSDFVLPTVILKKKFQDASLCKQASFFMGALSCNSDRLVLSSWPSQLWLPSAGSSNACCHTQQAFLTISSVQSVDAMPWVPRCQSEGMGICSGAECLPGIYQTLRLSCSATKRDRHTDRYLPPWSPPD